MYDGVVTVHTAWRPKNHLLTWSRAATEGFARRCSWRGLFAIAWNKRLQRARNMTFSGMLWEGDADPVAVIFSVF